MDSPLNELLVSVKKSKLIKYNMKEIYYRITDALKIGYWAFKNPRVLQPSNFKMLSDLFTLMLKVAKENKHYMTHIAYIHPEEGEKQIVSIWAGAGIGADPLKRIAELISENSMLKEKLYNESKIK